jgi:mitochondrial fission protein ELM1
VGNAIAGKHIQKNSTAAAVRAHNARYGRLIHACHHDGATNMTDQPCTIHAMQSAETPSIWVLADDRAGNVSQAIGVAEALHAPYSVRKIRYTSLAALPNRLRGATLTGLTDESKAGIQQGPFPKIVIAAGRRTAPVVRWIKQQSPTTFTCQIMYPGAAGQDQFDLIAVPQHDNIPAIHANMITVTGAPHRISTKRLGQEAPYWAEKWAHLPRPFLAVLVGGQTKSHPFTVAQADQFGMHIAALALNLNATVLLTTSRRTGKEAENAICRHIPDPSITYLWSQGQVENPYFGMLALADVIAVTGDSMSMCSEACGTKKPVYIFAPKGMVSDKHARLHTELYNLGFAAPLTGEHTNTDMHLPLNAAVTIAQAIRDRSNVF